MSLREDLKSKVLALVNQQMNNWVVEIQRNIGKQQEDFVRALDQLQETVARFDERIDENAIDADIAEVLALQPPPEPVGGGGPGAERVKASLAEVEKGASLSEVLTYLVNEVAQYVDRAAMFIVKGNGAVGWYGRGFDHSEVVKQLNIPLSADTVFRIVFNSRHALRGHVSHSPSTAQAIARLGGNPQGVLAVPLVLREKLAAILYCDTTKDEVPADEAAAIEIIVLYAGKIIDLLSLAPKAGERTSVGSSQDRAAAIRADTPEIRERAGVPRGATPAPLGAGDEGSGTVMFRNPPAAAPRAPVTPAAPPPVAVAPADQKAHEDAKRFARLVVSEIKLYNEAKVADGRRSKDLYERLKEDIEKGRQMYTERVPAHIRNNTNYFYDELVRILAGGDQSVLGPM
jgi:hypothetical protein